MELKWSNEYNIGNNIIDAQHKRLFELVNSLSRLDAEKATQDHMKKVLDFTLRYAARHFKDEEILQAMYQYPDYKAHKKIHEDFVATASKLVEQYLAGFSPELFNNLKNILYDWVKQHILVEDRKIGEYTKGRVPDLARLVLARRG